MKKSKVLAAALAMMVAGTAFGESVDPGIPVVNNDQLGLNIYGRGQEIGTGEVVPSVVHGDAHERVYLFLNQARLGAKGWVSDAFKYDMQLDFGGEDINGSNTDMSLLDMVADVPVKPLGENTVVKIGQFRVPYSREGLTDTGYMDWTDRSIANFASYQGRDYGLAIMGTHDVWTGTLGTFSGGGRDIPQRYLPEDLGVPELVARVGYNDGVDQDIYHVMGTDRALKRDTKAFYVNGLYMGDTRIGHSTAMGLRTIDDNMLVDANYNPYLKWGDATGVIGSHNIGAGAGQAPGSLCSATTCERGSIFYLGTDGVVRHYIDDKHAAEFEYEGDWGGYQNRFGVIHIASGRGQADYQAGKWEFGVRYAILSMGDNAGFLASGESSTNPNPQYATKVGQNTAGSASSNTTYLYNEQMGVPIHEITPSISYHFHGQNMKIVAALPIFVNAPLWIDQTDGAYVFTDPTPSGATTLSTDEGSVLETAGNITERRTIPEGRLMFQFQF